MSQESRLSEILSVLPGEIASALNKTVFSGETFEEIRLRRNMPVGITKTGKSLYLTASGKLAHTPENAIVCRSCELDGTLLKICEHSVFAHTKEIENGYISMPGGIRVGIGGDFSPVLSGIGSVNIRIPREVKGCADEAFRSFSGGMLISGAPGSGKTTMLRELIRKLSWARYRVSVIDSRREISGGSFDMPFDLGPNTDVIFTPDRAFGALCALKCLYPQIIAFDEIGTEAEVKSVFDAFGAGAYIVTTAHAGSIKELNKRTVTRKLLESGAIEKIVMLSGNIGEKPEIYDIGEALDERDN